jgi:hypothetical protein
VCDRCGGEENDGDGGSHYVYSDDSALAGVPPNATGPEPWSGLRGPAHQGCGVRDCPSDDDWPPADDEDPLPAVGRG